MDISAYIFKTKTDDGETLEFKVKPPDFESYTNLTYKTDYSKQVGFFFSNIVEPSRQELEVIVERYPGIVEAFSEASLSKLKTEYYHIAKRAELKWKSFDNRLGESALALLEFMGKPMTEDNLAIALLFVDGLQCLRHLRRAYSKDK